MFKNYLLVTVRSLSRDYGYALINLCGLSIGIACFLILALHLESELQYDQHYEGHESIYRVVNEINTSGTVDFVALTSREIGPILKKDYPEVTSYTRFFRASPSGVLVLRDGNVAFYWDNIWLADENVFEMFPTETIYGDPQTALIDPLSIAISESMARKYFGDINPIGKTLATDTAGYRVSLVFADQPENTHLKYNGLLSYNRLKAFFPENDNVGSALWGLSDYTYVNMPAGYDVSAFDDISEAVFKAYMLDQGQRFNSTMRFFLEPLASIHLGSETNQDVPRGNKFYVYAFSVIAVFVLAIACINYMNLATARSVKRTKEIGMRKIMGAHKEQVVYQFLGESFIFAFVSLAVAMILVYIVATYTPLDDLLGRQLVFNLFERPELLLPLIGLGSIVGLISGIYPAFYLSAIRPITALRGSDRSGGQTNGRLRQALVFVQFAISVGVIACTLLMAIQMHYIQTKPLGFDKQNKVLVTLRGSDMIQKVPFIKGALAMNSRILGVAAAEGVPGFGVGVGLNDVENNDGILESYAFNAFGVGEDFFDVMGIELIAGRSFGPDTPQASFGGPDSPPDTPQESFVVVNEAAVRKMGWDDPIGKRIENDFFSNRVIGVVKDFHIHSLHRPVEPLFMFLTGGDFGNMTELNKRVVTQDLIINISPEDIPGTLSFLREKFAEFDPEHPFEYRFYDDLLDELYVSDQRQMQLIGIFAIVCILISCLGLFGLASFTTSQRTKEIGIRRILGASSGGIVVMLYKDIVGLILVASVFASAISYYVIANWLAEFQYKQDINVAVFLLSTALAMGIAFVTVAIQSYKTARANPGEALRYEQ